MLAKPGRPFDSQEHLFEVKWDGIRVMVYRDQDRVGSKNSAEVQVSTSMKVAHWQPTLISAG